MCKFLFCKVLDFLIAFFGILILFPLFTIIFIILLLVNNGKPFFFLECPRKGARIFKLMKFKTTTDKKDAHGNLLPKENLKTAFNVFLSYTGFDEISEIINHKCNVLHAISFNTLYYFKPCTYSYPFTRFTA